MRTILFAAVALALYSGANAAPITTTQSTSFGSITGLVATDTISSGGAVTASADKTLSFDRFNATTGVLTGVSSGLSFTGGTLALNAYGTEVKSGSGKPAFASSGTVSASSGVFSFGQINGPLSNSCSDSGSKCFDGNNNLSGRTSMQKSDTTWGQPHCNLQAPVLRRHRGRRERYAFAGLAAPHCARRLRRGSCGSCGSRTLRVRRCSPQGCWSLASSLDAADKFTRKRSVRGVTGSA